MSIITPITGVATQQKNRTYKLEIDTPNGVTPGLCVYRETLILDAEGNQLGANQPAPSPLTMQCSDAVMAALPAQFQGLQTLLSEFGDWLEQNPNGPVLPTPPTA